MDSLTAEISSFRHELLGAARPAIEADEAWRRRIEEHIKGIERRLKRIEHGYGIGDE